jgi:sodium-dependent dicarboxylate transporter 2/3/5
MLPTASEPVPTSPWKIAVMAAGPLLALFTISFLDLKPGNPEVTRMAGVALWMAVWWIGEAVPLAVTAMLPVALFPLLSIMSAKTTGQQYFNDVIFLFLGGFIVALAMERWNLHRRIALRILLIFGGRPRRILLGFMIATAFLSMWISNTATTMMMVPIVLAILRKMEEDMDAERVRRFSLAVLLGVAYAASLGGIATPVGTPPNLSFRRIFYSKFEHALSLPGAPDFLSFEKWMLMALPITVVMMAATWAFLSYTLLRDADDDSVDGGVIREQYTKLGPMSYEEKLVLIDFVALALLWLTRKWWVGMLVKAGVLSEKMVGDGTVAVCLAIPLFMIASRTRPGERIMDWPTAVKLPWGLVLLFGGGFALAKGFDVSGLSKWLGVQLSAAKDIHPFVLVMITCLLLTFLTELTSNTATTEMFLPVLASLAVAVKLNPLLLMVPATLSCSCAFMLPVATPPNAIVFGTERIPIRTMAKYGLVLNALGVIVISLIVYFWAPVALGFDPSVFPDWAKPSPSLPSNP